MSNSATGQHTMAGAAFQIPDFRDNAPISGDTGKQQGYQVTVVLTAPAAADLYFGYSSAVTNTTGLRIPQGSMFSATLAPAERAFIYGASGVATYAVVAY